MSEIRLKYPNMREELIVYLRELSDAEYQRAHWVANATNDGGDCSQFDYSVHFLFDDTPLSSNPENCLGLFLKNQGEVELIRDLVSSIEVIFERYGTELSDEQYIGTVEWEVVIRSAKVALKSIL